MKKLLKLPLLVVLLLAGGLLTGCVAATPGVAVATAPPRPRYYYDGPYYRPHAYYRPAPVIVRPAPIIVRPRPVFVQPGPRYYRGYRGHVRY